MNEMYDIANIDIQDFTSLLLDLLASKSVPDNDFFLSITNQVNNVLDNEESFIRPHNHEGKPGGLLDLSSFDKVLILPDLHARRSFIKCVLFWKIENMNVLEHLQFSNFALLCLGDGVHSEGKFATRWVDAYKEFINGYKKHSIIDQEISDSFNLMLCIMCLKVRFPKSFHFLKGNHENIKNETAEGNYSFAKFSNEGAMVIEYFKKFYSKELIDSYYNFEKKLPLFVKGRNFLASHAEPAFYFNMQEILNYHHNGALIEGLTWTDNFSSEKDTIDKLIAEFNPEMENGLYFGGHRPIKGKYLRINNDKYIQIHNPHKQIAALIYSDKVIDLDNDICEVPSIILNNTSDSSLFDFTEHF